MLSYGSPRHDQQFNSEAAFRYADFNVGPSLGPHGHSKHDKGLPGSLIGTSRPYYDLLMSTGSAEDGSFGTFVVTGSYAHFL